ncbi:(Fe-S)-binding protein [Polyangium fumosum]|uniref:4Fe-4S dicluster domain-containing protein n=1 Tax=Polyangium fumosum TaxID=889272 RepID=A0A4U1IRY0_9BACT|nr:(Fe-S)-binding protein [Polyangium fumosum]TKC97061.1 4Fe-4S dicluster domain-containing protein [Polyangium fumosum]
MNPLMMFLMIFGLAGAFAYSAGRRWSLLQVGRPEDRFDDVPERVKGTAIYALAQKKMHYYRLAGAAHMLIFLGFVVLLARSIILWGRGFDPSFNLFILGPEGFLGLPLGHAYEFLKDVIASLVIVGALVFLYFRVIKVDPRMTKSGEAILILGIIMTMMLADMLYDGASMVLHHKGLVGCTGRNLEPEYCDAVRKVVAPLGPAPTHALAWAPFPSPAGSFFATLLAGVPRDTLLVIAKIGFWTHASLVLIFANVLPYSKHFHVITAVFNVFFRNVTPRGRLPMMAPSAEAIGEMVMKMAEEPAKAEPVGVNKIQDFTWKAILDFYTCTECGRCSDNCPAHKTGKLLSPKQLTLNLRDHLYDHDSVLIAQKHEADRVGGALPRPDATTEDNGEVGPYRSESEGLQAQPSAEAADASKDLVANVIHPDVLWACTTCRACEEQCPVMISYVDKIVEMRRHLVLVKGEFPAQLNGPFQALEVNGNPWNLARMDRANWAEGLDVPMMSDNPKAEVLYWVGCAASYDDRAKKIARATARLLKEAGVDFAVLGQEETCTGDPARRAGNEYLFAMLAEQNVATLNGYKDQGGVKKIITACPHCFNTILNEYPDFGAKFEVVHHTDYLLGLVAERKLSPKTPVKGKVVFHDSCYLGRYNDVYEQPRDILKSIPGVELVEAEGWNRNKGLCCGAGGAQFWMEEQNKDRVNVKRTLQLLQTEAKTIATACPFCQTMITDGLKAHGKEESVRQLDVSEILLESCLEGGSKKEKAKKAAPEAEAQAEA